MVRKAAPGDRDPVSRRDPTDLPARLDDDTRCAVSKGPELLEPLANQLERGTDALSAHPLDDLPGLVRSSAGLCDQAAPSEIERGALRSSAEDGRLHADRHGSRTRTGVANLDQFEVSVLQATGNLPHQQLPFTDPANAGQALGPRHVVVDDGTRVSMDDPGARHAGAVPRQRESPPETHGDGIAMCGICGSIGLAERPLIEAMTASLAHRGPDGEGIELFPRRRGPVPAALGHRRLSIIDPCPRGPQPMSYGTTATGSPTTASSTTSASFGRSFGRRLQIPLGLRHGGASGDVRPRRRGMLERLNGIFAFASGTPSAASCFWPGTVSASSRCTTRRTAALCTSRRR